MSWILVAVGTPLGALARYGLTLIVAGRLGRRLPLATLAINISGALAIGYLAACFAGRMDDPWSAFLVTGFLGGYTTYSTFSLETLALLEEGRVRFALGNVVLSFVCCVMAVASGFWLGGGFVPP